MLKFLIILFLGLYIFYKVSGYLFKAFLWSSKNKTRGDFRSHNTTPKRPAGGNVNVDHMPDQKRKGGDNAGEYVDYEEVK